MVSQGGHPECPGEPQPRARGAWEAGLLLRMPTPEHGALGEAGCERGAETWRSKWGLPLPSPWQPNFWYQYLLSCAQEEQIWQAWWGQTLAHTTHLAEAVIYVLKPFLLLSLVTGAPVPIWALATQMKDHIRQFPWMLS